MRITWEIPQKLIPNCVVPHCGTWYATSVWYMVCNMEMYCIPCAMKLIGATWYTTQISYDDLIIALVYEYCSQYHQSIPCELQHC